jgi:hypothetical protein
VSANGFNGFKFSLPCIDSVLALEQFLNSLREKGIINQKLEKIKERVGDDWPDDDIDESPTLCVLCGGTGKIEENGVSNLGMEGEFKKGECESCQGTGFC